ncbi:MAG: hypothetical protein V3U09_06570, partial [Thermoplasmata archaeon]
MTKEEKLGKNIDRPNAIGGVILVLVLIGVPFGSFFYQFNIRQEQMAQDNIIEILAHKEEVGGWSQDEIELKKGETYTIRLLAIDVTHSFEA